MGRAALHRRCSCSPPRTALRSRRRRGRRPRTSRPRRCSSTLPTWSSTADGRAIRDVALDGQPGPDAPAASRLAVREPGAPEFGPERSVTELRHAARSPTASTACSGSTSATGRAAEVISLRARFSRPGRELRPAATRSRPTESAGGPPSLAVHERCTRRLDRRATTWPAHRARRGPVAPGRASAGRSRCAARGRASDVVAGAGAGRHVRGLGARRRGRGAGEAGGPRHGGAVQRIGRARERLDDVPRRLQRPAARLSRMARARAAESGSCASAVLPAGEHPFPRAADGRHDRPRCAGRAARRRCWSPIPERDALLAWTDWDGAAWRVRAAVTGPGARFSAPFDVSPAGEQAVLGDAAVRPPGTPVAGRHGDGRLEPARRRRRAGRPRAGGAAPARRHVRNAGGRERPRPGAPAGCRLRLQSASAGPPCGRSASAPTSGVPLNQITTFLRSSTRPG